jgi:hypothetical protein
MCSVHPPDLGALDGRMLLDIVESALFRLQAEPLSGAVDDQSLQDRVGRLDRLRSMVDAEQARAVSEMQARRPRDERNQRRSQEDLARNLRLSRAEARRRLQRAKTLERLPQLAAKLAAGEANAGHVDAAARGLEQLDRQDAQRQQEAGADVEAWAAAKEQGRAAQEELDGLLAEQVGSEDGASLGRRIDQWAASREADAQAARDARARARRGIWFDDHPDADGLVAGRFRLLPAVAARFKARLDAEAARRSKGDERSLAQRRHDALEMPAPAARDSEKPGSDEQSRGDEQADNARTGDDVGSGGSDEARAAMAASRARRARALIVTTPEALRDVPGADLSMLDGVGPVGSDTARMLCCGDADITVVAMHGGQVLDIGRVRDATPQIWSAVVARDRECLGCGAPAVHCDLHHVRHWGDGGHTSVTNLVLLCLSCHDRVHHSGWRVSRRGDGHFVVTRPYGHPPLAGAGAGAGGMGAGGTSRSLN